MSVRVNAMASTHLKASDMDHAKLFSSFSISLIPIRGNTRLILAQNRG